MAGKALCFCCGCVHDNPLAVILFFVAVITEFLPGAAQEFLFSRTMRPVAFQAFSLVKRSVFTPIAFFL
jgi:hypothetical protein